MEHDEQETVGSRPRTGQGTLSWDRFDPADNARERRWTCDEKPDPDTRSVIVDPLADQTMSVSTSRVASIEQGLALPLPETGRRVLYLRAGAYRLSNTLILSSAANGMAIAACPGEVPVLGGNADADMLILRETRDVALIGLVLSGPSPVHIRDEKRWPYPVPGLPCFIASMARVSWPRPPRPATWKVGARVLAP